MEKKSRKFRKIARERVSRSFGDANGASEVGVVRDCPLPNANVVLDLVTSFPEVIAVQQRDYQLRSGMNARNVRGVLPQKSARPKDFGLRAAAIFVQH